MRQIAGHSWQITEQGKSGQAKKGMVQAAKVMAALAVEALADPALVARAKADHQARTAKTPYDCPLSCGYVLASRTMKTLAAPPSSAGQP